MKEMRKYFGSVVRPKDVASTPILGCLALEEIQESLQRRVGSSSYQVRIIQHDVLVKRPENSGFNGTMTEGRQSVQVLVEVVFCNRLLYLGGSPTIQAVSRVYFEGKAGDRFSWKLRAVEVHFPVPLGKDGGYLECFRGTC